MQELEVRYCCDLWECCFWVMVNNNSTQRKGKGVYFYLQALSAKGWSPKGRRGKEEHFTCEATGGIRTWDLLVCSRML